MNSPVDTNLQKALASVSLEDKYTLTEGHAFMSGTQALVRLPMLQQARDEAAGLQTAGFISGYRGSPLGALDQALWRAKAHLDKHHIVFQPGLNEDIAATSIWGTQQLALSEQAQHDGVFGMWYGKGPGVDRSMDVLKHANNAGTAPHGGVLALAGDDHAAQSSTVAYQSEHNFIAAGIPVLYPATVQEYLDYGLHGWALSRFSGLWAAMKCVTEIVGSSASVCLDPARPNIDLPSGRVLPPGGLGIRLPDNARAQEARLVQHKLPAALAYIRHNRLNQIVVDPPAPRVGIMAAGKAWLDTRQALTNLGLDDETCRAMGIRLIKIGCVWPVPAEDIHDFASGLQTLLVIEEKRPLLETALKDALYHWPETQRPHIQGKHGSAAYPCALPAHDQLSAELIAPAIAQLLDTSQLSETLSARIHAHVEQLSTAADVSGQTASSQPGRMPWFCSGCPHNTSTRLPEGSRAMAGIGCHFMATWMDRNSETFSQMGGEGAAWIGQQPFTSESHVFANLGDGTYFHSGVLAIRASIAAGVNITYKILYNDAVAMTGGQPVDGVLTVPQLISQVHAEGARRVVVVTDDTEPYRHVSLPGGATVHHRDELDLIQRELRDTPGTTVLVYDQTCATEKRRRRKRGTYPDPAKRIFINPSVCEGCGDCSVKSNCLSVEPLETMRGTKRQINQSTCNKDFSCVNGFCPSFVMAEGAELRRPADIAAGSHQLPDTLLPVPEQPAMNDSSFDILITGVGGTGVVTLGSLLGMAAHLERKAVSVLDMAGLAQKGGAVFSHVKIAEQAGHLHATRISHGSARLVLGCDSLVTAGQSATELMRKQYTHAVINSAPTPTAAMIGDTTWSFPARRSQQAIEAATGGKEHVAFIDATALAGTLLGDTIYANPLLLGFAWQQGQIPLSHASLMRAIELNGVKVVENRRAFEWGRHIACQPSLAESLLAEAQAPSNRPTSATVSLDELIAHHTTWLTNYQNAKYAKRYTDAVAHIRQLEAGLVSNSSMALTRAVAVNLAKLMAYKDEYEVARLYTEPAFLNALRSQFEGEPGRDYELHYYLAPPLLTRRNHQGEPVKRRFGPRTLHLFRLLAKLKGLRGSIMDPFGKTTERRQERALIHEYFAMLDEFSASLTPDRLSTAIKLASLPDTIRGFGHIKENNLQKARQRRQALMEQYHHPKASPSQAVA